VEWLCRVFGFRLIETLGPTKVVEGPAGGVAVLGELGDEIRAWMSERTPEFREGTSSWPILTPALSLEVPDVDAHHAHATAEGATILGPPTDQPWGMRSYVAVDLGGHHWQLFENR